MSAAESLENHLAAAPFEIVLGVDGDMSPVQPWQVVDDAGAQWALRKLGQAERELARIEDARKAEIERVNEWAAAAARTATRTGVVMRSKLVDYRHRLEADDPKLSKTYRLPGGALTVRAVAPSVEITDGDAFTLWALASGQHELLKIEPRRSDIKAQLIHGDPDPMTGHADLITADGEKVPGVHLTTGDVRYGVTLETEATS